MKNTFSAYIVLALLIVSGIGCSSINPFSGPAGTERPAGERPATDRAVDKTLGRTTTGVRECDEVSDLIEAELNNSEDNFIVKAAKATILNRIKDGIRESVEKNKNDTVELAKTCKEFKVQFEKYKAEEEAKKGR
jgi:hypothetical protein